MILDGHHSGGEIPHPCVLITGASGFLGSHVVRASLRDGQKVVAAIRAESDTWRLTEVVSRIAFAQMDLTDPGSIQQAITKHRPDLVIHCAAYGVDYNQRDPRLAITVNINGTSELMDACARNGTTSFVYIGSCFEYGEKNHRISEGEKLTPVTIYGATKAAASIIVQERSRALGMRSLIIRPFGMWGRFEGSHRLVPQIVEACVKRVPLGLTGCEQTRDYSHIRDISSAIVALAVHRSRGQSEIINIGSGKGVRLKDFVLSIARQMGGEDLMQFGKRDYRSGEVMYLVADVTKQEGLLGAIPRVPIDEGIREMILDANQGEVIHV